MTCGFTTNTTMTKDSDSLKQTLELTAELIKDLRQDHKGLAWFPTVITMPNKGMIFPEPQTWVTTTINKVGENEEEEEKDWGWTVVKAVPIPEDEQPKYPDPRNPGTNYKHKMDMKNKIRYQKLEFMDAAEELGMFVKPEVKNEN